MESDKWIFTWLDQMDSEVLQSLESITTSDSDVIIPQLEAPVKQVLNIVQSILNCHLALGISYFFNIMLKLHTYTTSSVAYNMMSYLARFRFAQNLFKS